MTTDDTDKSIPDMATAICLGDGRHIAWCIGPDGGSTVWLLAASDGAPEGCAKRCCAPHEQPGRKLPEKMREKLGLVHYCGAITARGTPCKARVQLEGEHCFQHDAVSGAELVRRTFGEWP
jgi:hypothetical protein